MSLSQPELACESVLLALKVSRLTFSFQETPFSCYVTIRKKFVKNYNTEMSNMLPVIDGLKSANTSEKFESLEKENTFMKIKLEEAERIKEEILNENESFKFEIEALEEACKQRVAAVAEEKRIISENLNLKISLEKVKQEKALVESELASAVKETKNLNKSVKLNEKKVYDLEKENRKVKEDLLLEKEEFSILRAQVNKEKKDNEKRNKKNEKKEFLKNLTADSNQDKYQCKQCDELFNEEDKLRNHKLNHHTRSISTQTNVKISVDRKIQVKDSELNNLEISAKNDFEKYSCFYCAHIITSEDLLKKHIGECHGLHEPSFPKFSKSQSNQSKMKPLHISSTLLSFPVGFPPPTFPQSFNYPSLAPSFLLSKCEYCGWYASCGTEMMKHKKNVHNDHENPFKF